MKSLLLLTVVVLMPAQTVVCIPLVKFAGRGEIMCYLSPGGVQV